MYEHPIIPKNHFCLSCSEDIKEIARPLLDNYPITFFDFFRVFHDGSFLAFATNSDFLDYYYNQTTYRFLPKIELSEKTTTYYFASANPLLQPALQDFKERFQLDNYFLIIQRQASHLDVFGFASELDLPNATNFYLSNLMVLEDFTFLFKEKAHDLIQSSTKHKITFPKEKKGQYAELLALLSPDKQHVNASFRSKIIPLVRERIHELSYHLNIQLTSQERICLIYSFLGLTNKQIAKELNISSRTVESHFEKIQLKFGRHSKSELIELIYLRK